MKKIVPARCKRASDGRRPVGQLGHVTVTRRDGSAHSRKGSKKTEATVEIKPPVRDGINNPVVVRQDGNVQVIGGKFLGDFQRHYGEKGYQIFDWVLETNPLASACFVVLALLGAVVVVSVMTLILQERGFLGRPPAPCVWLHGFHIVRKLQSLFCEVAPAGVGGTGAEASIFGGGAQEQTGATHPSRSRLDSVTTSGRSGEANGRQAKYAALLHHRLHFT